MTVQKSGWSLTEAESMTGVKYRTILSWIERGELVAGIHYVAHRSKSGRRNKYVITAKGIEKLSGQKPFANLDDYLDEVSERVAAKLEIRLNKKLDGLEKLVRAALK